MSGKRGILYLIGHDLPATLKPDHVNCSDTAKRLWATKIGLTKSCTHASVDKRISRLKTGNPFPLVTKASISCNWPGIWEKYFHKTFGSKKVQLEWYALHSTDFAFIKDTVKLFEETGQGPNCALFEEIMSRAQEARVSPEKMTTPGSPERLWGPMVFREVRDIRINHEELAKVHGRSYLDNHETEILNEVIKGHPEASKKIGVGIQHFFVAEARGMGSYCFHVERVDGSEEDFSYRACFGRQNWSSWRHYTHCREPFPSL